MNLPNLLTGATQLAALRDAAPYLEPYIVAFKALDTARQAPKLHALATYIRNINATLGVVPDVTPWISACLLLSARS